MANIKISDLPAAVAAQLAMEFEVNDNGTSRRVSGAQIDTLVLGATNGFVARVGTNARAARTLTAGAGVAVTNGNGASGNPAIALSTASQASLAKADAALPSVSSETVPANPVVGGLWFKPSDLTLRGYKSGVIGRTAGFRASTFIQTGWVNPHFVLRGGANEPEASFATWTSTVASATNVTFLGNFASLADLIPDDVTLADLKIRIRQHTDNTARMLAPTVRALVGSTPVSTAGTVSLALTTNTDNLDTVTLPGITAAQLRDPDFRIEFVARKANSTLSGTQSLSFIDMFVTFSGEVLRWTPTLSESVTGKVGIGTPAHPDFALTVHRTDVNYRAGPGRDDLNLLGTLLLSTNDIPWVQPSTDNHHVWSEPGIFARIAGGDQVVSLVSAYNDNNGWEEAGYDTEGWRQIAYGDYGNAGTDETDTGPHKGVFGHYWHGCRPDGHGRRNYMDIDAWGNFRVMMPGNPGFDTHQNMNGSNLWRGYFCRAYVNYDGVAAAVRASNNVSSVTRVATGEYRVNISKNMPDADYAVAHSCSDEATLGAHTVGFITEQTVSRCRIKHHSTTSSTTVVNKATFTLAIFR